MSYTWKFTFSVNSTYLRFFSLNRSLFFGGFVFKSPIEPLFYFFYNIYFITGKKKQNKTKLLAS